jgi:hypothetical protein
MAQWLSRGSAKTNACLLHVVVSQWTRVAINPSQAVQRPTWIPRCFACFSQSRLQGISTIWSLSPYTWNSQRSTEQERDYQRTQDTRIKVSTRTQVATGARNTTQWVHNSTRALYDITMKQMREVEVLVLRNVVGMLGVILHAPRGPFYSPKAARSRWEQSRKADLAFCRLAHRTVRCTPDIVRCPISFQKWRSRPLAVWEPLAHRTVRCPLLAVGSATCPAQIARSTVGPADRWLTGQSGEL